MNGDIVLDCGSALGIWRLVYTDWGIGATAEELFVAEGFLDLKIDSMGNNLFAGVGNWYFILYKSIFSFDFSEYSKSS